MTREITLFHSPDSDDAFMFYGLACKAVDTRGITFDHQLRDIQTLNQLAIERKVDFSAVSVHACPYLMEHYAVLRCGASMGGVNYGPRIVGLKGRTLESIRTVATPGPLTSAKLALKIWLKDSSHSFELIDMHFEEIQRAVLAGTVDSGLIIHEGQITHGREGLNLLLDLGQWWWNSYQLPLPLGVNVIRKDFGAALIEQVSGIFRESIEYGLAHKKEAIEYAMQFGRGLSKDEALTFVSMYVNSRTIDIGEEGMRSISLFLSRGAEFGFVPKGEISFV